MPNSLDISRQTASKVLTFVVADFFPGAQLAGTGITPIGFYADFNLTQPIDDRALTLIEERMRGAIKSDHPIKIMDMMRKNAAGFFKHHKQKMLADLILNQSGDMVEVVEIGHFHDLNSGECAPSTGAAGVVKLLKLVAEADIIRIEGTCFPDSQQLKHFLKQLDKAKKSDPQVLASEMRLFEEFEGRLVWFPNGMYIRNVLLDIWRQANAGALDIDWGKIDPIKVIKKLGYKREGGPIVFAGLRGLRDEAHILCSEEDLQSQVISSLHFINKTAKMFSFEYRWHLVVPARKSADRSSVERALKEAGCNYTSSVGEELSAEMRIVDLLGREWPVGGMRVSQSVLTRSLYGDLGRYIARILEQCAGKLPFWMAPEQVRVVPIGEKPEQYAKQLYEQLKAKGFRIGIAHGPEALGAKVHAAERERVPYVVIVGDKEEKTRKVTLRSCYQETVENGLSLSDVVAKLRRESEATQKDCKQAC